MGLDIYLRCDGQREEGAWAYVRISGQDYSFRNYVRQTVFHVPEDFPTEEDPCFQPDWGRAYEALLLWLKFNRPDNDWIPSCLDLLRMCHEAIHWGPERHELEWWG
jgi:hypothetical protein